MRLFMQSALHHLEAATPMLSGREGELVRLRECFSRVEAALTSLTLAQNAATNPGAP